MSNTQDLNILHKHNKLNITIQAQPYIEFRLHKRGSVQEHQVLEFCSGKFYVAFTPYIVRNRRLTLYADSVLLIATGHLLLTRTSVRGVEVPKDGLRLRITCNNFNDSTMSTKGTRRAYPIWVYTIPTSRRMHLVSSKDRVWYLTFA